MKTFTLIASLLFSVSLLAQSGVSDPVGANDENGDGKLSLEEFDKIPVPAAVTGDAATRFGQADTNHDGFIEKAEMDARRAGRAAAAQ